MKIKKTTRPPRPVPTPASEPGALRRAVSEAQAAAPRHDRPAGKAAPAEAAAGRGAGSRGPSGGRPGAKAARPAGRPEPRPAKAAGSRDGSRPSRDDGHQPAGTQRLFFALKVPANLVGPLREAQRKLRGNWRRVDPDQLHVTLAYLPAVPADRVDDLKRLGVTLMQDLAPMQVSLRGTGYYPNEGSPRVWFVKVEAEGLPELAQALRDGIHALGLETDDQPFKGHITLARKKGPAPRVPPLTFTHGWQAGGAVLYRSILRKTGPIHETASSFRFRAPLPTGADATLPDTDLSTEVHRSDTPPATPAVTDPQ
ncbi:RNA 2',3'-cyclic phosphodiesterase [Deinococcus depolymerans]|uniref:RNA 2',3'-cyclic phosphodiesterase n=1 Tax=Deinococcus depolymerans TaxID=392408 RepID=A0ABN1C3D2_9DEIO